MRPSNQVLDEDFTINRGTDRRIRGRAASSRARRNSETQSTPVESGRPRRCATRKTHLQNGDFLLFDDDTGVDDPFDSSFQEQDAMQMSDDSHGHANIRSTSSRSRRRPRRRPRDADDADYHLQEEEVDNLSDNDDDSGSPAVDYCNPEIARLSNQIFEIEARGRERGREYYDLLLEATKEWDDLCSKTFKEMARCCLCGACELGGSLNPTFVNVQEHRADVEGGKCRAQRNNPTLPGKYTFRNGRGQICWKQCKTCHNVTKNRTHNKRTTDWEVNFDVMENKQYAGVLLGCHPRERQLLQCVDVGYEFTEYSCGSTGMAKAFNMFLAPLVREAGTRYEDEDFADVGVDNLIVGEHGRLLIHPGAQSVLFTNLVTNPVYRKLRPMAEVPDLLLNRYLAPRIVESILEVARNRNPAIYQRPVEDTERSDQVDGDSPSNDALGPPDSQTTAGGHADGAGTDPSNSTDQAHEQDMIIVANDPVYRNALYGSTAMNVGKVYPRHVDRNSSLCEPEQLACYPSGIASIRRQHTTNESGEYPTAHSVDEPGPSSDDSTDTAEDVPEELELLHLPNSDVPMTAENTIFPYLFPQGTGHFIPPPGKQSFVGEFGQYLKNRLSCLFSPFTLVQEYILMMYQILIVMQYTTSQRKFTLTDAYKRRRITHPNESEEKCIRHLIKYKVPGTIDFSPQWWRIKVNQINALTKESGMPDYFLTLTVDNITELKWDEYKQMDDILAELNNLREDRGAYKLKMNNCQAEAAVLFHHRVTNFMNYFILGGMKRLGEITKYTCRYEMQGRQAVHAHILLWSTPESVARYSNQIQRDILLDEGPDGTLQRPDAATNPGKYRLHQIISRKQIHNCNGKCLRRGGCKLHFPHGIHLGDIELDELNNSYDYYCPNYESRNVVEYDPLLLMAWNGHMNLKRVTHSELSFYVCKYTMKSEPTGKLEVNGDVERQLNMARIDPAVVKVVNAATQSQPVSHVEASLQCLGIPVADMRMKHNGRWIKCPFLYIRTEPQEIRRTMLSCSNGVITPHMDYYENRPDLPEMEHITYPEYFRTYRVLKKRLQGEDLYVGQDKKNRFVYKHKCPQIVHFTNHPPTSLPEGFFYNLLLSTVSFRMEGTLLTEGSYFKKCQALGMVDSDEDLERDVSLKLTQHLQQYYRDYNITKYCILTDVAKLREYYKTGANVRDRDDRTAAFQTDQFPETHLALQCPVPLNEDQQNVFDALCRSNFTGLHVINGGPGTGKTFLINKIIQHCTQVLKQRVLVTASTGAAARNLPDGSTLHSALSIGPGYKRSILHSTIRTESKQYAICQSSKVLIIDEAFMLTGNFLQTALAKYASVDPHANRVEDVFTTKAVILVGDPNQLPPICHCKSVRSSSAEDDNHHESDDQSSSFQDLAASVCTSCLTERCHYFQYATQHTLHISERQRQDPEFAEFLQNMLHAPPTQADIERVLGHCVLRPDRDGTLGQDEYDTACNETWIEFMSQPGAISLHAHLKKVAHFNTAALHAQFPRYDIIPVDMVSNYEDIARMNDKAARQKKEWCFSEKFHSLQKIAIGCSVVCTQNFGSLANPVFNGDRGIVTSITRKRDSPSIQTIHVLFHGHDVPVGITRKQEEIKFDGHQFVRKTFPLMLAKAMTIHRCQGASITGPTLMDFRDLFAPGMGYVMLSRKTSREGLKLTALPTPRQLTIVKHLLSDRHGPA